MGKRLFFRALGFTGWKHKSGLIPISACSPRVGESAYLWLSKTLIQAFLPCVSTKDNAWHITGTK